MDGLDKYNEVSLSISRLITRKYSTSFSLGIRFLAPRHRNAIYAIYGFVRLGDEIVDSFHHLDKTTCLSTFRQQVFDAIANRFCLNPVLHAFQLVVNRYSIDHQLIDQFLKSMEMDLHRQEYNREGFEEYILGSAEVVGLMCLRVFLDDDPEYHRLKPYAMKLGSAFQKINFLRDLAADVKGLQRCYFPDFTPSGFNETVKKQYENDMAKDFRQGMEGIRQLPFHAARGVWLAYLYYVALLNRIRRTPARILLDKRVRVPDICKYLILFKALLISPFIFRR